jgi:hypothetical protein
MVLCCRTLGEENCAAMDFVETAIWKLVPLLGTFVLLVVDSQVPLRLFRIAVRIDELVFFLGGRLVFAPRVSFIHYSFSLGDEFFGVLE